MKKITQKFALFTLTALALSSSALAIDQVTLNNGQVIEGKVLNDVPNRYVDIELVNGTKQRFQKTEVSSVERDVPSSKDASLNGNDTTVYVGALGGLSISQSTFSGSPSYSQFNYGARFGVNAMQIGDLGKLAVGLAFDRFSISTNLSPVTAAYTSILAQVLLRKIANTGFYIGPELGLSILTQSDGVNPSVSGNSFEIGGLVGYDFYLTPSFSFGPEIHFDGYASTTLSTTTLGVPTSSTVASSTAFKFLLGATLHL